MTKMAFKGINRPVLELRNDLRRYRHQIYRCVAHSRRHNLKMNGEFRSFPDRTSYARILFALMPRTRRSIINSARRAKERAE